MKRVNNVLDDIASTYSFWGRSGLYGVGTSLTLLGREPQIRRKCVEQLQLLPGGRVLDIACGTGRNHPYLVEAVGASGEVVGLDYTPEMLDCARRQAEQRDWQNVTLLEGDAATIDLVPGTFDGVIGVLGFGVIPDHREAVRRCAALLRMEGRMVICDATPFRGLLRPLNVLTVPLYRRLARWNTDKDLLGALGDHLELVNLQRFNGGSIYVATGVKENAI